MIAQNQEYVCNKVLATEITFGTVTISPQVIDLLEEGDAKIGLVKA